MARLPTGWRHGDERSDGPQLQHRLRIGLAHLLELLRCQPRILRQCSQNSGLGLITREILGVWTRPIWARLTATTRLGDGAPPPAAPLSAASAPHPEPLEPPRKELEGTPAGSAPFAVEPFQQAVEVVAEREGADSRGADGLQSLPRERDPAVGPGEAEGYPLSILVHPRALPQDGLDAAVEPTGAEPAPSAPAMPLWKPLAGAGEPLAGAQRGLLESAFADSLPEVRLPHGRPRPFRRPPSSAMRRGYRWRTASSSPRAGISRPGRTDGDFRGIADVVWVESIP